MVQGERGAGSNPHHDQPGDAGGPAGPETPPRRHRIEPLLMVTAVAAIGLVFTWLHHARIGLYVVAGALVVGATLRAVLPARDAGLLVNRSRAVDSVLLFGLAIAVAVMATVTPRT